jgi:multidrug efflux pump
VRAAMDELRPTLPQGMVFGINFDSSRFIEESVTHIEFELILAVLLTAFVCWIFLGSLSSTLNVVLAIPMSLLGTIAIIYFLGFTLNTFTLLALSLCVGIVVDDAIMIMENIFRHAEEGKPLKQAAYEGTTEIAFAALAATVAVIAIFVPVVFMEGVIGKFFLQFGVTLSIAVALSYIEAVTLAPARCSQMLSLNKEGRNIVGRVVDSAFTRLRAAYSRVLLVALKRPVVVLVSAAAIFVVSIYVLMILPRELVPSQDQSRLMVRVTTAVGNDLDETDKLFQQVEHVVNGHSEIERAFVSVGGFGGTGSNSGVIFVTLHPKGPMRPMTQSEFSQTLRRELNAIPGVRAVVQDLSQQGFSSQRGFPVEFSVRGPDWDTLVELSQGMFEKMQQSGLVVDLDTDYQIGMPELRVTPERDRAADLGVSMDDIGVTLNSLVGGVRVGKFAQGGRRIDVRLRLLSRQRSSPEDIRRLRVRGNGGELIPLGSLITHDEKPALQSITRRDRERAISLMANVAPGHSQNEVLDFVQAEMRKDLPPGYAVVLGGASTAFQESFSSLLFALVLGILVAYMVLAAQFNSFLHPVTVLTILPLSIAGAAFALLASGNTLNMFSMIGLLLLMGIVKKNSIILIDYTLQLKATGLSSFDAVAKAGPIRLRPILMTSTATMMAAVPAAVGLGLGSEVRTPMAIAVIGGVILSTLLSLLVVPCFYIFSDRVQIWLTQRFRRNKPEVATGELPMHDSEPPPAP